jgi:hypothetical protein
MKVAKANDRFVSPRSDGTWVNQRVNSEKPASVHETQQAAIAAARQNLINSGGGELNVQGRDGQIRSKDTIGGGNDPRSIRDTEH